MDANVASSEITNNTRALTSFSKLILYINTHREVKKGNYFI